MVKLLTIAGLGPGDSNMVTPNVQEAISCATDIVGYIPYVARIPPRDGLVLHASDNRVEIERAELALDLAASGKKVLIVGHSNTIPETTNILIKNKFYSQIEDNNNSNLYFVNICDGIISHELLFYPMEGQMTKDSI